MSPLREQAYQRVREVPAGKVASYGDVGRSLDTRVSGLIVGKWLDQAPEGLPWWRIVGADGTLLTAKKSPHLARQQRELLEAEGIEFEDDRVAIIRFREPL